MGEHSLDFEVFSVGSHSSTRNRGSSKWNNWPAKWAGWPGKLQLRKLQLDLCTFDQVKAHHGGRRRRRLKELFFVLAKLQCTKTNEPVNELSSWIELITTRAALQVKWWAEVEVRGGWTNLQLTRMLFRRERQIRSVRLSWKSRLAIYIGARGQSHLEHSTCLTADVKWREEWSVLCQSEGAILFVKVHVNLPTSWFIRLVKGTGCFVVSWLVHTALGDERREAIFSLFCSVTRRVCRVKERTSGGVSFSWKQNAFFVDVGRNRMKWFH